MNLQDFAEEIAAYISERGYEASVEVVNKLNGNSYTGIVLNKYSGNAQPVLYLEEAYRSFQDGTDMEDLVDEIIERYQMARIDLDMEFFYDYEKIEKQIYIRLINFEKNEELLKCVPHVRWHDLAEVFYYAMELGEDGRATILLYNHLLEMWGKTAEEVYETAKANMERDFPGLLATASDLFEATMGIRVPESGPIMYVLTIPGGHDGAAAILYSTELRDLADRLQSDLLILPVSIHELILVKDDQDEDQYEDYRMMVRNANRTFIYPDEYLSDSLYLYDREKDAVEMI
ncbi:MAG: hypothetical protein K2K56_04410 [Lachnospiraceae bacterium]|nr:hypothetical protein [Lachnospiraceae bacterium]